MRELPILFSGPMVKAILEGRKTMTRRVIKPQPPETYKYGEPEDPHVGMILKDQPAIWQGKKCWRYGAHWGSQPVTERPFPESRSQVGDRLWVRETWGVFSRCAGGSKSDHPGTWLGLQYKADEANPLTPINDDSYVKVTNEDWNKYRQKGRWQTWRPSIHMPRWASRISLEVTAVKVERLQEISREDARAEGCTEFTDDIGWYGPEVAFCNLWDSINGKTYPWASNPWVWVYTFKRIEKQ